MKVKSNIINEEESIEDKLSLEKDYISDIPKIF